MDKFETDFLKTPFFWSRYIDDAFFIWTHVKEKIENFMKELNSFCDHVRFTLESS